MPEKVKIFAMPRFFYNRYFYHELVKASVDDFYFGCYLEQTNLGKSLVYHLSENEL